jgi:CO/xanthine dehydrogenase FAD-binding subunit
VPAAGARHYWRKVGTRKLQAISKVVLAAVIEHDGARRVTRSRLAFGSVAPVTLRARHVEAAIAGRTLGAEAIAAALGALEEDIAPIDDIRSTRDYRARVSANLVRACLAAEPPA